MKPSKNCWSRFSTTASISNEVTEHEHAGDDADENPDQNHEAIEKLLIAFLCQRSAPWCGAQSISALARSSKPPVEAAQLNGFGDVCCCDSWSQREICDGPGNLEDGVAAPGAELPAFGSPIEQCATVMAGIGNGEDLAMLEAGVTA